MQIGGFLRTLFLLAFAASGFAQDVTSVLLGVVTDPADAVVPHAAVIATETSTGLSRSTTSDEAGRFRLNDVRPGTYSIRVEAPGFKAFGLTNINLLSQETRDLGKLALEVGSVSEEVKVMAQSTPVQTASSERSASVTPEQLSQLSLKGRDPFDMMHLIPGVVDASIAISNFSGALAGDDSGLKFRASAGPLKAAFDGVMSYRPTLKIDGTLAADAASLGG